MKCLAIILLFGFSACGQRANQNVSQPVGQEILNSKYVRLIQDTSKMMLIENVVIQYGEFQAESDSALLDRPNNTVTVYGLKKASFKGKEIDKKDYNDKISYTKGAARFYTD